MADELLNTVIRLENSIQQQLQHEQARADAWLAGVRTEIEKHTNQSLQELAEEDEQTLAAAVKSAELAAEALIAAENKYCCRLEKVSDHFLLEVLGRHLQRLLPGHVDDHQDVQN